MEKPLFIKLKQQPWALFPDTCPHRNLLAHLSERWWVQIMPHSPLEGNTACYFCPMDLTTLTPSFLSRGNVGKASLGARGIMLHGKFFCPSTDKTPIL